MEMSVGTLYAGTQSDAPMVGYRLIQAQQKRSRIPGEYGLRWP